jgi:hypothetical protein
MAKSKGEDFSVSDAAIRDGLSELQQARDTHARVAADFASKQDPDDFARVRSMAERHGLPVDVVMRHRTEVEQRDRLRAIPLEELATDSPKVAEWMRHPHNAALASDDLVALRQLELATEQITHPGSDPTGVLPPGFRFSPQGGIDELDAEGQVSGSYWMGQGGDHYALWLRNMEDREQERERLAAMATEQADTWGALTPVKAGLVSGVTSMGRLVLTGDPSMQPTPGAAERLAASQITHPGLWGDVGRAGGQVLADLPLMFAGGPMGQAMATSARMRMLASLLAPISAKGAHYLPRVGGALATTQPMALRSGLQAGHEDGLAAGLGSYLTESMVPAAFGATGLERVLLGKTVRDLSDAAVARSAARHILTQSGWEATEEATTELANAFMEVATGANPDALEWEPLSRRLAVASIVGGGVGGAFNLPEAAQTALARRSAAARAALGAQQNLTAGLEMARESKLAERSPADFAALLRSFLGSEQEVFFQREDWDEAWAAQGEDPLEMARAFGVGEQYVDSLDTGQDLAVPVEAMMSNAKREGVDALASLAKTSVDAMTGADAARFFDEGLAAEIEAGQEPDTESNLDEPEGVEQIRQEITGQLVSAGAPLTSAQQQADLYAAFFSTMAARSGRDALEIYREHPLAIGRELPEALTNPSRGITDLDELLDRLRRGERPDQQSLFGPSLLDTLRERGLQEDPGGEVASRDINTATRRPFARSIVREDGLELDRAAELLQEAGYLQERSIPELLDKIDQELRGERVYVPGNADESAVALAEALDDIEGLLEHLDIDLAQTDNAAIREVFQRFEQSQRDGTGEEYRQEQDPAGVRESVAAAAADGASPQALERLRNLLNPERMGGQQFYQAAYTQGEQTLHDAPGVVRGAIRFTLDDGAVITLTPNADKSTFLHETGHFFLEVFADLATAEDAPQQMRDDFAALLRNMDVESRSEIQTPQHEWFARHWEAYLRSGKAPSQGLGRVFAAFRSWLVRIYKSLRDLAKAGGFPVALSDEVTGIMDRMLATDAEITEAREATATEPILEGDTLTEQEQAEYARLVADERAAAEEQLAAALMKAEEREQREWWKQEEAATRRQVEAELDREPSWQALAWLQRGELPSGNPDGVEPYRLNKAAIVAMKGEGFLWQLPGSRDKSGRRKNTHNRGRNIYAAKGNTVHPDAAAQDLGFTSGDHLLMTLANLPDKAAVIKAEARRRMTERHGDALLDGTIAEKAMEAANGDRRGERLVYEVRKLARRSGGKPAPTAVLKNAAARRMRGTQLRHVRPHVHRRAMAKAAREAFNAAASGDVETALAAKQRELLNHYLFQEATKAREDADRIAKRMRRFEKDSTRAKIGKANEAWLEQVDALLERFEFKRVSNRALDRRQSLAQWIANQEEFAEFAEMGGQVDLPQRLLDEQLRTNYRELTLDEIRAISEFAEQINHLADVKTGKAKIIADIDLDQLAAEVVDSIEEHTTRAKSVPLEDPATKRGKVWAWLKGFAAEHRKLASILRELDGFQDQGPMWSAIMRPLNDAADREQTMSADAMERYAALVDAAGIDFSKKEFYPEIGASLSRGGFLAAVLNMGNDGNRTALAEGHGWNDAQLDALVGRLTKAETEFVQGVWDLVDSFWPEIAAKQRRVTGLVPEKVEATPLETPHGTLRGGYYPLAYQSQATGKPDKLKAEIAEQIKRGHFANASTRRGHTKERQGRAEGDRVRLDLSVASGHIGNVIHDLTHHETLAEIHRLLKRTTVKDAITAKVGPELMGEIEESLTTIAQGDVPAVGPWERSLSYTRNGVAVAAMGYSVTTALQQPLGLLPALARLSSRYLWKGMAATGTSAVEIERGTEWVFERSDMMRNRAKTINREIAEISKVLSKRGAWGKVQDWAFYPIAKTQLLVDVPVWRGAYLQAMERGASEKAAAQHADQTVIDTQSGGMIKDLASIQRGGPGKKLFTLFSSYFLAMYNLNVETVKRRNFKDPADVVRFIGDMAVINVLPALLSQLMLEAIRGDLGGDDDDMGIAEYLARNQLSYLTGMMIGVREVGGAFQGWGGYSGPAGTRFYSDMTALLTQAQQGEVDAPAVRAAGRVAGILLQAPASQIDRTLRGLYALGTGETANPAALLVGPPHR